MVKMRNPRILNTSRILRHIWRTQHVSRIRLAHDLGLNKSTVTNIVSKLIKMKIIIETMEGLVGPAGGRRPMHIELNKNFGCVIGLEIRPESYTAVVVDLAGNILFSRTEEVFHSGINLTERVCALLERFPHELSWIDSPLLGAGVGISGIVDSDKGLVLRSIPLRILEPYDFNDEVGGHFSFPVFIANDANACAWGELTFHRTQKLRNFMFTLVEFHKNPMKEAYENTSVGFGVVFEGKVYHGNQHSAGEFRSVFCAPHSRGQFRVSSKDNLDEEPKKRAEFIQELSKHLALFINTFNLGQVFLGGDIEHYQHEVTPILMQAISNNWVYDRPVQCAIQFSSLSDKSVAYGAAGMVLEQLFSNPNSIDTVNASNESGIVGLAHYLNSEMKTPSGV